jgi:uncharacterized protein YkwD
MCDKNRIISMFMILTLLLFTWTMGIYADEVPQQGVMYSGPGTDYSVVETVDGQADIQVYGEVDDWYIVYNADTGKVGCMEKSEISAETAAASDTTAENILTLTNQARESAGLAPLAYDKELCGAAYLKASDMVQNNYFSHHSEVLGSPFELLKKSGVVFNKAAENLAGNTTPEGAFYSWMDSDAQKANILNENYTRTGIGIYSSPVYGQVFVQLFAN